MLVIAERINATNRSVGEAIASRDAEFITRLAQEQSAAGAHFIDVNAGAGKGSSAGERETIEWLVEVVQSATDRPLCIDSESPQAIQAAVAKYRGEELMINSVTAEEWRLEPVGSLAAERRAKLVALAMGAEGIPDTVEKRLAACDVIMERLGGMGIKAEQVFFDPLVLPISVDSKQGMVALQTLQKIKLRYPGVNTVMGLSNVSYGLPERKLINRSFLLMAAYAGLDAAILDPLDKRMMSVCRVADLLTAGGASRAYLNAHRKGMIVD